jgi:hypothetical protein
MVARIRDVVTIAAMVVGFTACVKRAEPIDFFIPANVRGWIVIVEDKNGGENVDLDAPVFFVPTNGILRLKTLAPFERWHTINARYLDGGVIPAGHYNISPDDDVVRLYGLGSTSRKSFYYLGSHKQAREAHGRIEEIDKKIR